MARASDVRSLTQDMAQAHDDRAQEQVERTRRIAEIGKETAALLRNFDKAHSQMSAWLKAQLAEDKQELDSSERDRKKATQAEIEERAEEVAEMRSEAVALLQHFDEAHAEMSAQLKAQLAKEKQGITRAEMERKKATQADAKARAEEAEERAAQVQRLLEGFRKDSAETAAAWRDLVATMQAKRGMAAAPRPVRPPVAAPVEEEMPVEEIVPEEKQGLENRILDLIMEHAEGIKLIEMTEATGEARVKLGNITRMLLDEGKIRKEGLLYFPAQRP